VLPSRVGSLNKLDDNGDVLMAEDGAKTSLISGYSEMGFKRDQMRIVPLY